MRPGQNKRLRGRNNNNNNNNRKGPNPLTRSYESNGPDVKVRGTAQHVAEKYLQLARDAQSSGDPVMAESYLQHAEHYYRLIAAAHAAQQTHLGYGRPNIEIDIDEDDEDAGNDRFASVADRLPQAQFPQPATVGNGAGAPASGGAVGAAPYQQNFAPQPTSSVGERAPRQDERSGSEGEQNQRFEGQRPPRYERNARYDGDRSGRRDRPADRPQERGERVDYPERAPRQNDNGANDRGGGERAYRAQGRRPREAYREPAIAEPRLEQRIDTRPETRLDTRIEGRIEPSAPRAEEPAAQPIEAVGLPAFITTPIRPPVAAIETAPLNEEAAHSGESAGGGYHLRPRRRRRRVPEGELAPEPE